MLAVARKMRAARCLTKQPVRFIRRAYNNRSVGRAEEEDDLSLQHRLMRMIRHAARGAGLTVERLLSPHFSANARRSRAIGRQPFRDEL